ncbi:hypothetical protein MNBD_GAMMA10-2356 [hydrothermal vent metagenome]|uniref:Uncharacterized protein n=1 Tax=hydrothermal vent metagenome TaxID=652676 RepID=A0A3B0XMA5_9ZZZZ
MKCKIRKGLLILRDCSNKSTASCTECARPMCNEHGVNVTGKNEVICSDCYAKQEQDEVFSNMSSAGYRHGFYQRSHYRGIYIGSYFDDYYDDYDMRAFDPDLASHTELNEEHDGDFFDS